MSKQQEKPWGAWLFNLCVILGQAIVHIHTYQSIYVSVYYEVCTHVQSANRKKNHSRALGKKCVIFFSMACQVRL